jgi:deoxyhypusine monooxygenase
MLQEVSKCGEILADEKENLAKRFRALFTLRNIVCEDSINAIGKVLVEDKSDLLKHECAYCMGQMKDPYALPYLIKAIKDEQQHPMVRHEAGEALGAIGKHTDDIMDLLRFYSKHNVRELSETCDLALDRLKFYDEQNMNKKSESISPYNSVDPTPSYPDSMSLSQLRDIYLGENNSLFDRYRALFTLRNVGTPEAIQIICEGFFGSPSDSALFKHEVAFVLGQIQSLDSVDALTKKLADVEENEIVRHECAEALGSIGKSEIISKYIDDESTIVRESCQVALDMADYYNDESQFDFIEQTNPQEQPVA